MAGITSIDELFMESEITSFDELQYLTGLTSLGEYCFVNCSNLTSITIPDSVTSLESGCFTSCSSLTSIVIPDSVTSLETNCFEQCSSLTTVTLESITPPTITFFTFYSTVQKFFVPDGSVASYKAATNWDEFADKIFPIT